MNYVLMSVSAFTRLPVWKIRHLPKEIYSEAMNYWAISGWVTGGIMAVALIISSYLLPYSISILFAIGVRMFLTGAFHEDGWADFVDGFGGGHTKARILSIMKDSHIGTYGVIALLLYLLILWQVLASVPLLVALSAIITAEPLVRFIGSHINILLPYARPIEESKIQLQYNKMGWKSWFTCLFFAVLPLFTLPSPLFLFAILAPIFVLLGFTFYLKHKIQGYTGDCCGAYYVLGEISYYSIICIIYHHYSYYLQPTLWF